MFASEYGVLDSVNFMLGIMNTFNVVYPTLYEIDLREDYSKLEAPEKELVWFAVHAPNDVLLTESITPIIDGIGSVFQVVFIAAICILIRKDIEKIRFSKL